MSPENDAALRKTLDAVDAMRRRIHALGWLVVATTLGAYAYMAYVQRVSDDVERLIGAAVLALTCVIAWTSFSIILIVVRMTRRVLRAIELMSQGPPPPVP